MLKHKNSILGFTASCFDLGPHAGHLMMLAEAKLHCDYLVVGLHINPKSERSFKNKPVETVSERVLKLMACKYVDHIIPYETEAELLNLLLLIQPDIRFLGSDYIGKDCTGKNLGIPIHYCKRDHKVSSSEIRAKIMSLKNKQK